MTWSTPCHGPFYLPAEAPSAMEILIAGGLHPGRARPKSQRRVRVADDPAAGLQSATHQELDLRRQFGMELNSAADLRDYAAATLQDQIVPAGGRDSRAAGKNAPQVHRIGGTDQCPVLIRRLVAELAELRDDRFLGELLAGHLGD